MEERRLLRLLEAALSVSEYTGRCGRQPGKLVRLLPSAPGSNEGPVRRAAGLHPTPHPHPDPPTPGLPADKVDVLSWRKKSGRVHAQIRDMCAILCGLVVAQVCARAEGCACGLVVPRLCVQVEGRQCTTPGRDGQAVALVSHRRHQQNTTRGFGERSLGFVVVAHSRV